MCAARGTITDIQRFCVHDGPGIRTTVFLKGCNLRCRWCHNPETLRQEPEIQTYPSRCIGCGACLAACEQGARTAGPDGVAYDRERCTACGRCAEECFAEAVVRVGREATVEEVMAEVVQDRPFYEQSGGGMTVSGGEPLFQLDFAVALLEAGRSAGLHTAVETNLSWPWEQAERLVAAADLVMMDVKALDADRHREWTGAPNARILENARRVAAAGKPLIVRTPVIPGLNDAEEAIGAIAAFAAELSGLLYYELLPYHPLGASKYESLGLPYLAADLARPTKETMAPLTARAQKAGIPVRCAD